MPGFDEIRDYDDIIDECMEWIGRKWTTGMIKMQMREMWPGIKVATIYAIISRAKKKICKLYNIDPNEYKGSQISFYESMIRSGAKDRDKIKAAERLDALFGLENISGVDPADLAAKIRDFRKAMDSTIGEQDGGNKNVRNGKTDAGIQESDAKESGEAKSDNGAGAGATNGEKDSQDAESDGRDKTKDKESYETVSKPADSVVDSEKAEIIEELKHCDQVKKDLKTKPQPSPDNI